MHSNESLPPPASGPTLLQQLGRLIMRARSRSPTCDTRGKGKVPVRPSTSKQIISQPKPDSEPGLGQAIEAKLNTHVQVLWNEHIPICIEVLLSPDCQDCYYKLSKLERESFDKSSNQEKKALLLERWTMSVFLKKSHEQQSSITSQWLMNAIRSQLHFSQLSAWLARLADVTGKGASLDDCEERRRKLSRETCNFKKLESNCDAKDLPKTQIDEQLSRKLNIIYSIKIPGESYKSTDFIRTPVDHTFPITDLGSNSYLKIYLESLPRVEEIPIVKCSCNQTPKRRASKDIPSNVHEDITNRLSDLNLGNEDFRSQIGVINQNIGSSSLTRQIFVNDFGQKNVVDDRMHTPCSENGKHRCNCDDESDGKDVKSKKLDERRIKEIAKYKRRLRKETKLRKLRDSSDSNNSESETKTHTSIPILQASRFDRFRAIGCYRNQTYLTLPASKIEGKSPFFGENININAGYKKTNTIGTQTDDIVCNCGNKFDVKPKLPRSDATYDLVSISEKRTCDNVNLNKCDKIDLNDNLSTEQIIKRPKLKRFFPINDRIEQLLCDREKIDSKLNSDVNISKEIPITKRQKCSSLFEDYVLYEKCFYGTFDEIDGQSPRDEKDNGFEFSGQENQDGRIPSQSESDSFRFRFDSAASMVFHSKTGLPLTSSPAPLKRGSNCFDYDDSIIGVSGIKSALFHPISTPAVSPVPKPTPPPPKDKQRVPRLRLGPSSGLLGSFEESALKGRLEPVATVAGFTAELGASGSFCPPHKKLPVTVFFYAPGGTNAPYMGHINLGSSGYKVAKSGTIQVSLFNPHGTLVKMFVVLYDLTAMPASAKTFLRQRTLYLPAGVKEPPVTDMHKYMRYLIHLRFMTSKSGKLYIHTDIRIIVSRKADMDTATAHSAIINSIQKTNQVKESKEMTNKSLNNNESDTRHREITNQIKVTNHSVLKSTNENNVTNHSVLKSTNENKVTNHSVLKSTNEREVNINQPCRVFGGCSDFEIGYDNQNGVSYELRSFTYGPENPKYSPR